MSLLGAIVPALTRCFRLVDHIIRRPGTATNPFKAGRHVDAAIKVLRLEARADQVKATIEHEFACLLAALAADTLEATGAENYLSLGFYHPAVAGGEFEVLIRPMVKPLPHELRRRAEAERDAALARLAAVNASRKRITRKLRHARRDRAALERQLAGAAQVHAVLAHLHDKCHALGAYERLLDTSGMGPKLSERVAAVLADPAAAGAEYRGYVENFLAFGQGGASPEASQYLDRIYRLEAELAEAHEAIAQLRPPVFGNGGW